MTDQLQSLIRQFQAEYLDAPVGQQHLATGEDEIRDVQKRFAEIRERYASGQDITDAVLKGLLPHLDTEFHRKNNYRVSTWPCIRKDVRGWFENTGWKQPEDWQPTARLIFESIDGLLSNNLEPWNAFIESPYRQGFGTGFITPILFCLDQNFPVINSKVVRTYKYCCTQLGQPDEIDAKLANYLKNAEKVRRLREKLAPFGIKSIHEFDIFCHYIVSNGLLDSKTGKREPSDYGAWLFVANPNIFMWRQAFDGNGVNWQGSRGAYAQKLIREQIKLGDRVFGYQAGPHYEVCCELATAGEPYRTTEGSWAVNLKPIRWLNTPISLATLKGHPELSKLKFIQQTQMSISGITSSQVAALEELIQEPAKQVEISDVDRLCRELLEAQYDTRNPDRFEAVIAEAFEFLGFEAEHIGGPGQADVIVTSRLGSDTFKAVVDGKTRQQGSSLGQVNYQSIIDHKEENEADYALIIAPAFAGGKPIDHAHKANIGLLTADALGTLLRQHDHFPFRLTDLRRIFATRGLATSAQSELSRLHTKQEEYLQLTGTVLQIFENLQRQQETSTIIDGRMIYFLLLQKANQEGGAIPRSEQIDEVLSLLSNSTLGILAAQDNGYILTLSPGAARARLSALASVLVDFV